MDEERLEFFKLDSIDKKVLFWMMDNNKDAIACWTKEIAKQYTVHIDPEKLLAEIKFELKEG